MDGGDTASLPIEAERQLAEVEAEPREVVADKGEQDDFRTAILSELRERAQPRPPQERTGTRRSRPTPTAGG